MQIILSRLCHFNVISFYLIINRNKLIYFLKYLTNIFKIKKILNKIFKSYIKTFY